MRYDGLGRLPRSRRARPRSTLGVGALVGLTATGFCGFAATLAALPWWATEHVGATRATAGLVTAAMLVATVAAQFAVPALVVRLGAGRSLALGLLTLGAPAPLYLVSSQLTEWLLIGALRGVGFALVTVAGSTLVALLAPAGEQGRVAGLYGLAAGVPIVLAAPAALWLTQLHGAVPMVALATLPAAAAALAWKLPGGAAAATPPAGGSVQGYRAVAPTILPAVVALFVITAVGGGLTTVLPLERPVGPWAGAAIAAWGAAAILGRWQAGQIADRIAPQLLLRISMVGGAVGLIGVGVGLAADHVGLWLLGAALFGAAYGAVQTLTLVTALTVSPASIPAAAAIWNAAFDAGTAVGAGFVGAAAALGGGTPLTIATCGCALTLLAVVLPRTGARRQSAPAGT